MPEGSVSSTLVWRQGPCFSARSRSWKLEKPRESALSHAQEKAIFGAAWLAHVSVASREALAMALDVNEVRAGELVLSQGELATRWYGVACGAVRLSSLSASGRIQTSDMVAPGEWFGEVSVFGGEPEASTAHAQVDSTLVSIRADALRTLTHSHKDLRHALLCWSSVKQRALMELIFVVSTASLRQRLALRLLDLGKRFGQPLEGGFQLELGLTQTELAEFIPASRQRLNEGLRDLRRAGVLNTQAGQITVLSIQGLQQFAVEG